MMRAPTDPEPVTDDEPLVFDALLYPHRSLSPAGFWALMTGVVAASFAAGTVFVAMGAWPVFGFFGLDVLLLAWCFRRSFQNARLYETVQLSRRALTVRRVLPSGRSRCWTFQTQWLRVELAEPVENGTPLALASHGRRLTIGGFLSPEEKVTLAGALREALQQARSPGPQLSASRPPSASA